MIKNAKKPAGMLAGDFMQTAKQLAQLHAIAPAKFKHKAESMGLSARKAYYLLEVHQAFRLTKAPKDRLLGIGWTKAQLLSKVVTGDNWLYWLEQAEALAVHEL